MDDAAIKAMTVDERLELIDQLWDSLSDRDLVAAQREEIDRRLATLDEDLARGINWNDFKAELQRRFP